jgi:hypothetical protein
MDKKEETIAELRRVASKLGTDRITQRQFKEHGRISISTVKGRFGTWNEAVKAANLKATPPGPSPEIQKITDEQLLEEVVRLAKELGKNPSERDMNAKGRFSSMAYRKRWNTFVKARQMAYAQLGRPDFELQVGETASRYSETVHRITKQSLPVPTTFKPRDSARPKKVQFGEPIDFRGLRFAPINEQGVVYVFAMISRELGFLIESIQTGYPDCEGKRCVDQKRQRWEHVRIEFEYKSSCFRDHGHSLDGCDLIVCWIHDWLECPIEVLELRSQIKSLPHK